MIDRLIDEIVNMDRIGFFDVGGISQVGGGSDDHQIVTQSLRAALQTPPVGLRDGFGIHFESSIRSPLGLIL